MSKSKLTGLLALTLLLMLSSACVHPSYNWSQPQTYWTSKNSYLTNILDVAQKETPFTIVLPSWLPSNLGPAPHIEGSSKAVFNDETPVRISYYVIGPELITSPLYIEEYHKTGVLMDNGHTVVIGGIDVREWETEGPWSEAPGKRSFVINMYYQWNKNGVHYELIAYTYSQDEVRRIVESMISQD
jgi:hypothetical protein